MVVGRVHNSSEPFLDVSPAGGPRRGGESHLRILWGRKGGGGGGQTQRTAALSQHPGRNHPNCKTPPPPPPPTLNDPHPHTQARKRQKKHPFAASRHSSHIAEIVGPSIQHGRSKAGKVPSQWGPCNLMSSLIPIWGRATVQAL